jgi:hypothetical protein
MIRCLNLIIRLFINPLDVSESLTAAIRLYKLLRDLSCVTITQIQVPIPVLIDTLPQFRLVLPLFASYGYGSGSEVDFRPDRPSGRVRGPIGLPC